MSSIPYSSLSHLEPCALAVPVTLGKGILRTATEEFLLSSRYKPHDPLAAEFIRTFRSRNFNGKFYLERYEALCKKDALVEVRVLLPKNAAGKGAVDVAALYGFRSTAPDLFFLSPWEFVQWILPERLQPPSATNVITKWTLAGKKKLSQKTKGAVMEAGVDYELDMTAVKNLADLFPFPDDMRLFGKHVPETYQKFRQTWNHAPPPSTHILGGGNPIKSQT